jgi:hypothetical protein
MTKIQYVTKNILIIFSASEKEEANVPTPVIANGVKQSP